VFWLGLLGALFNQGILASLTLYNRLNLNLPMKIGLAGMICGCVVALLPPAFRDNNGLRELLLTGTASWQFTSFAFVAYFVLTLVAMALGHLGDCFIPPWCWVLPWVTWWGWLRFICWDSVRRRVTP
jgi:CIC family chloride channel protein